MLEKFEKVGKMLSKAEQKQIKGGLTDPGGGDGGSGCSTGPCSVYDSASGNTYFGNCGVYILSAGRWGVASKCECQTDLGPYDVQGGTSACATS